MLLSYFVERMLLAGLIVLAAGTVSAQSFPNKPIRIVSSGVGGSTDLTARLLAPDLSNLLGQPVIVENRGGIMTIPAQVVAKAPPDGYTLLIFTNAIWALPFMQDTPYDVIRDFAPIVITSKSPNVLVTNASLPVNSVKELVALAKSKPESLHYGAAGSGSTSHLAAEMFKNMAGVKIVRVSYKGNGEALIDLVRGNVQLMFSTLAPAAPHVKTGRLRALAITSREPSALAPGLPTIGSAGLADYEMDVLTLIFAPIATSKDVVSRLNHEFVQTVNKKDIREKLFAMGSEAVGSSPTESAVSMKSDMARMGKLIKNAGIRAD